MKYLVKFFVIILITFCVNISHADDLLIVYINMDNVMSKTIAGKSLQEQLDKMIAAYKISASSPRQVAGDDTEEGNYASDSSQRTGS